VTLLFMLAYLLWFQCCYFVHCDRSGGGLGLGHLQCVASVAALWQAEESRLETLESYLPIYTCMFVHIHLVTAVEHQTCRACCCIWLRSSALLDVVKLLTLN
jgi:hypothetical protein